MRDQVELAKRLLESKGYRVRLKESTIDPDTFNRVMGKRVGHSNFPEPAGFDKRFRKLDSGELSPLPDGSGPYIATENDTDVLVGSNDKGQVVVRILSRYYEDESEKIIRDNDVNWAKILADHVLIDLRTKDEGEVAFNYQFTDVED